MAEREAPSAANIVTNVAKPAERQSTIFTYVRDGIITGKFQPGGRIPTIEQLEARFGISRLTIRLALNRLRKDGFIVSRGRYGTFVRDNPPHLSNYGVVLHSASCAHWSQYDLAFLNEAGRMHMPNKRVHCYHILGGSVPPADYRRILDDVERNRLAGLIFTNPPRELAGTPVLEAPGIPRVFIELPKRAAGPTVYFDLKQWRHKALRFLAAHGRRKLAFIEVALAGKAPQAVYEAVRADAARYGMQTCRRWVQGVSLAAPQWASALMALLIHDGPDHPDALVINDDNLVEHVTAGLAEAGVNAPRDMDVVAHANFPWPTPGALPVTRLGFSITEALQTAIRYIDLQRQGTDAPPFTLLPAYFEDELPDSGRPVGSHERGFER